MVSRAEICFLTRGWLYLMNARINSTQEFLPSALSLALSLSLSPSPLHKGGNDKDDAHAIPDHTCVQGPAALHGRIDLGPVGQHVIGEGCLSQHNRLVTSCTVEDV